MGSGRGEAGRRPPGSRTPEPGSIVVGAEGRGSEAASEARGAAPWSLSRRVPGEASAPRPGRARRASCSGDEEPFAPPAQSAAAAGRLHCLTTTRAGFSASLHGYWEIQKHARGLHLGLVSCFHWTVLLGTSFSWCSWNILSWWMEITVRWWPESTGHHHPLFLPAQRRNFLSRSRLTYPGMLSCQGNRTGETDLCVL
ncbi:zinc finger protein 664 isoform X10 [Mustela nigripes]|uniref:zinc finger protein 664 isoform X10 n=1 Tax=Mustela nigripes TaxID=77151 RepID=UPI002814ECEC|nr:zinc finger protein 664 isoform X10 [Mustela nigripes]